MVVRPPLHRCAGITMIEAVIAITVAGIIAAILGPLIYQAIESWSFGIQQATRNDQHRRVLETFTTDVGTATAVSNLGTYTMQLTISGAPVTYALVSVGSVYHLRRTQGAIVSTLATHVVANGFELRYFDQEHVQTGVAANVKVIMATLTLMFDSQSTTQGTSAMINSGVQHVVTRL